MNAPTRTGLFHKIADALEPAGIAVLSGHRNDAADPPSDMDVIGTPAAFQKIKTLIRAGEVRAVQLLQHETTSFYWVFHQDQERGRPVFLPFDFSFDYRRHGKIFYRAADLLPHRLTRARPPVLPPALEFGYYLVKKIGKANLEARHAEILSDLYRQDPQGCQRELARFFPEAEQRALAQAAQDADWSAIQTQLPNLQRVMRPASRTAGDLFPELLRRLKRVVQPSGLIVALLGPDGSGKSSLAEQITRDLHPAFRHTQIVHLRPSLRAQTPVGPVANPHGLPPRSFPFSLLKLAYWWSETLVGWLAKIHPAKIRSTFIVFDRFYHDLIADPKRYRFAGPLRLARWVGWLIPRPDLFLLLDLPAETARARKPEIPLEEARRLRKNYLNLAKRLPNAHVLDASRPLEEVAAAAEGVILNHLAQRLQKRLGL
ncbi:MAG: Thymidylate kinase [Anaerolineales bacterium]|nr:Thymidylate kinase [Anaerolineales bacterium]